MLHAIAQVPPEAFDAVQVPALPLVGLVVESPPHDAGAGVVVGAAVVAVVPLAEQSPLLHE